MNGLVCSNRDPEPVKLLVVVEVMRELAAGEVNDDVCACIDAGPSESKDWVEEHYYE